MRGTEGLRDEGTDGEYLSLADFFSSGVFFVVSATGNTRNFAQYPLSVRP